MEFCCPVYDDIRDVIFCITSSSYDNFFWLDYYEKKPNLSRPSGMEAFFVAEKTE